MTPTAVLHALGDLVLILDRDQRVKSAHGRWIETKRSQASDFIGKRETEEWPADVAALHIAMNARGLDGQVVVYDWEYPVAGSGHRMMTLVLPIYSEGEGMVTGIIRASRELATGMRSMVTQAVQLALQNDTAHVAKRGAGPGRHRLKAGKQELKGTAAQHHVEKLRDLVFRLSAQERVIVGLLMDSVRTSQIANDLGISVHTARQHVKHILRKLAVHSQQELLELLRGKTRR